LLIASSYSGSTEETVAAFSQALQTSAKKMVFTTGGQLKALAQSHDVPTFIFGYKSQPRAALPFSLIPLLVILQKLELISDKSGELMAMLTALEKLAGELKETSPLAQNPAKQLAQKLTGRLPVIYGAGLFAEVAHRWKTQINENSKAWSFYEVLPELNHNAVVGFPLPAELAQYITVVLLRPNTLYPRIALRYDITTELLKQANISFEIVNGEPGSPLAQMMAGVLFGDYVSYYLALLNHVEPAPVQVISYLKDRLKVQS
jgi:glucose/mannose-6-phosphate isomerase